MVFEIPTTITNTIKKLKMVLEGASVAKAPKINPQGMTKILSNMNRIMINFFILFSFLS